MDIKTGHERAAPGNQPPRADGVLRASFVAAGGRTRVAGLFESGGLRLKFPRVGACEAVSVNTAGGLAGGDKLAVDLTLGTSSEAVWTTQSAEKVYRAEDGPAVSHARLVLAAGARLAWLPQETLLFDGARLERRLDADLDHDAALLIVECAVFGRIASGEVAADARLRDRWRLRRRGRLILAEETRVDGVRDLDRPALGDGARAVGSIVACGASFSGSLDVLRDLIEHRAPGIEGGASVSGDILVARAVARDPARLRVAMREAIVLLTGKAPPRVWN